MVSSFQAPVARRLALRVVAASALALPWAAQGVMPLSPALTEASQAALLDRLAAAGFPEVGRNSVLIALASVLGFEPRDTSFDYDQPSPQLPKIHAVASPFSAMCATVDLVAMHGAPGMPRRLHLRGRYCLEGPARWSAREQQID